MVLFIVGMRQGECNTTEQMSGSGMKETFIVYTLIHDVKRGIDQGRLG